MLSKKEYIKRSVTDRRSSLDRRVFNFGPDDKERRMIKDRRKGWEDRWGWNPGPSDRLIYRQGKTISATVEDDFFH
jgi:hypothetical protein